MTMPVFLARRALRALPDRSSVEEIYAALAVALTARSTPVAQLPGALLVAGEDAEALLDHFATSLTSEVGDE